jgi:hypothetical protein
VSNVETSSEIKFTQEELDYLRSISICVATPAYGEQVSVYYTRSLTRLFAIGAAYDIPILYATMGNESLVTRARNRLVDSFLETTSTHLLFIDSDISFDPMDVFRLALHKKELVAGPYPAKGLAFEKAVNLSDPAAIRKAVINYVVNFVYDKEDSAEDSSGKINVKLVDNLIEVSATGTGFMLIHRDVFTKFVHEYGDEISYRSDSIDVAEDGSLVKDSKLIHAFFDTSIDIESNRYLSEDYTFCNRWRSIGGKVWIDPRVALNHHGAFTFRGHSLIKEQQ